MIAIAVAFSATAAISVVPARGASRPLVQFIEAPPSRTTATTAEFRFKTRATRTWCRRDDQRYRRCRRSVRYSGLRAGRHTFTIRVRHRGRTSFVRRRWTIVARAPKRPPARAPETVGSAGGAPQPAGPAVPAGPSGRKLVFGDEFEGGGPVDRTKWDLYDGPGNEGFGLRRPSAFSLDGQGNLVITAEMVNGQVVSGGMAAWMNFTYGRVEFRVRTEPDPTGTMSAAVLTWPQAQWAPEFTENDMYETGPIPDNTREFSTFIHFGTANFQYWYAHRADPSQWHTVAMEWYPDLLEIFVDGKLYYTITNPDVIPDVLHHVCIQLDARSPAPLVRPVRMFVDYIRVYQ